MPAAHAARWTSAPPSISRSFTPYARSRDTARAGSRAGSRSTVAPARASAAARAGHASTAASVVMTTTGPSSSVPSTRAPGGVRSRVSKSTRTKGRARAGPRAVSRGSSTSTVSDPTAMASTTARVPWACSCDRGPLRPVRRPGAAAMRPSRLNAAFRVTNGRPRSFTVKNASFSRAAPRRPTPTVTSMPRARSRRMPPPSTRGSGSSTATTTRRTPASVMRSTQGPVRPVWQHGSSVQ